jgi:hypothetical protein
MTQQEQDAILGRTRREYKEAKNKFGALNKLNSEIADLARNLALALEQYPDRILVGEVPRGSMAVALVNAEYTYTSEDAVRLSHEALRAHVEEYVSVKKQKAKLRQGLIDQGDDDPEA